MKKILLYILGGAFGAFALAIGIGAWLGANGEYHLAVLNSSDASAQITVSSTTEQWSVPAGEIRTITIGNQDVKHTAVHATILQQGSPVKVDGTVHFGNTYATTYVLDVTGTSCLVGVDFGGLYQADKAADAPIRIITTRTSHGEHWFELPPLKGRDGSIVPTRGAVSAALPASFEFPKNEKPTYGQWLLVPCATANNQERLAEYLIAFTRQTGTP